MKIEFPLVGTVQGLADAAGEVDIGSGNEDAIDLLLDLHDAMQGVLGSLSPLLIASEVDDFLLVLIQEPTMEGEKPVGVLITDTLTGRAELLVRFFGGRQPCPASLVKYGTALRTNRRVGQLAF